VLVEAEFPADIIDTRLNQAVTILEDLLKPIVSASISSCPSIDFTASNMVLLTSGITRTSPWTTTRSSS
jgi:hypothetical protein